MCLDGSNSFADRIEQRVRIKQVVGVTLEVGETPARGLAGCQRVRERPLPARGIMPHASSVAWTAFRRASAGLYWACEAGVSPVPPVSERRLSIDREPTFGVAIQHFEALPGVRCSSSSRLLHCRCRARLMDIEVTPPLSPGQGRRDDPGMIGKGRAASRSLNGEKSADHVVAVLLVRAEQALLDHKKRIVGPA